LLGSVRLVGGVGLVGPLGLLCLRAITTFLPLLDGRGVGLLKVQNVENVRQRGFDLLPRRTVAEHQPKTLGEDGLLMREATSNDLELQRMVAIGELVVGVANVVEHELHGNVAVGAVVPQGCRHEVGVEQDAVAMRGDRVAVRREVDRSSVLHLSNSTASLKHTPHGASNGSDNSHNGRRSSGVVVASNMLLLLMLRSTSSIVDEV